MIEQHNSSRELYKYVYLNKTITKSLFLVFQIVYFYLIIKKKKHLNIVNLLMNKGVKI